MEKWNSQFEHVQPNEHRRGLFGCGSLSITTSVSLLANEFDVRHVLYGKVSLAAANQMYAVHEAMNGCKNLKIH